LSRATLALGGVEAAFSRGGNRLCFVDPRDRDRCLKVQRPDRTPRDKRRASGCPKNLKPLAGFDDNRREALVYRRLARAIGEPAFSLVPRLHGWVDTDLGPGLCSDLIRDSDGRIAVTLKQYLWQHGLDQPLRQALRRFGDDWQALGMPSRKLLTHNIVVRCEEGRAQRLWVIDGLGWPDLLPLAWWWPALARHRARRRLRALDAAIGEQLEKRGDPERFGYHGWLEEHERLL